MELATTAVIAALTCGNGWLLLIDIGKSFLREEPRNQGGLRRAGGKGIDREGGRLPRRLEVPASSMRRMLRSIVPRRSSMLPVFSSIVLAMRSAASPVTRSISPVRLLKQRLPRALVFDPITSEGKRFEFFSPARNTGYGKRYVQEVDGTGSVVREFKETIGPDGVTDTKWNHGGP
ncbi:protein of unknown function (plasmid) [Shinella sp. WSC3-e]|nr:protein of unknown function [Shinella sp. WSC3-e]